MSAPHDHGFKRWLTTEEAAYIAAVKPGTVRIWVHRGRIHRDPDSGLIDGNTLLDYKAGPGDTPRTTAHCA